MPETRQEKSSADNAEPSYVGLLKAWQALEMIGIIAFYAVTFIIVAFSGDKDILFIWDILWKVFLVKIVVFTFFLKKHSWAVLLNMTMTAAAMLFFIYGIYFVIVYGEPGGAMGYLIGFAVPGAVAYWYYLLTRRSYEYYQILEDRSVNSGKKN